MNSGSSAPLEVIRREAPNAEIFENFAKFVKAADKVDFDRLFEGVDASDCSLGDWTEALVGFDAWLAENQVAQRPFGEMVGYIHCCTMAAPQTVSSGNLKVIVIQSLTDFGFDAVSDPQL